MDKAAKILDSVKHYQHSIEKHANDEQKVLRCIDKLFNLDVTVQHLQETGVGRTVNALRKEPGQVGQASRALVSKWKLMVAAEESDPETEHSDTTNHNSYGNGKDSDDGSRQPIQNKENVKKESNNSRHDKTNGDYSGSKRKCHSSEEEEPDIKKSKGLDRNNHDTHKKSDYNNHNENKKSSHRIKQESRSEAESDDESDHSHSESESEMSDSTVEDIKIKKEIKSEPNNHHKSSRHSSSRSEDRDRKRESSSKHSHDEKFSKSSKHSSSGSKDKHYSDKSLPKENSHHSHNSSKEKESISEKKHKSEHKEKEKDKEKKHKEDSKSNKHSSSSSEKHKSSSHTDGTSEKHKNEKHSSKSEKHRSSSQSHKSEKEKHKSSEKEISNDKHKSKDRSSSKEKNSSSSKEKSKEKSSSTKDKDKSEKKHSSSNDKAKSHDKSKDKIDDRSSDSRTKSSSSQKSGKSSGSRPSSKSSEDIPKKKTQGSPGGDSDDGIGCESGASFAEALGMISPAKPKKKPVSLKDSTSPGNIDLSPAALLAPTAKLAPLPALEISALPEISPNYKPRPPPKLMPHFTDEEAMSQVISSKNQRTKVYSGNKVIGKIPTLYEMCVHILQEHIDALEYTGGVPYEILKPVIDRATPQQLFLLEHYNPYLMEDTDHLWQGFCEKHFRRQQRQEMETWREMYMRCQEEQEVKLRSLTENIKIAQEAKKAPIKQTKMAYVDSVVKPPRNIARKQALHGTAHAAAASPAARVASLAAAPNILRGSARPTPVPAGAGSSSFKPKKAPLMAKALQFMRGRKR